MSHNTRRITGSSVTGSGISSATSSDRLLESPLLNHLQSDEISMKDLPDDTDNRFVRADEDGSDDSHKEKDASSSSGGYPFSLPPAIMLLFLTLLEFLIYYDRGGLAAGLKQILATYDINQTLGGVLGGAYLFGYCTTAPFFAYLANFAPPLKLSAWGMFAWVLAVFLGGCSKTYSVLLICRIITGVGESSFLSVASTMIDAMAPLSKRSLWLSLFYSAIPLGYALGEVAGGIIVDSSWSYFPVDESWRMVFVVEGVLGLVMVILFCLIKGPKNMLLLDTTKKVEDTDSMSTKLRILLNNPTYLLCVAAYAAQTFTVGGASYYTIEYLQDVFDMSASSAGTIFGLITVTVGFLGTALGGAVLDRVKQKNEKECVGDDLMPMSLAAINMSLLFMLLSLGPALLFPFLDELLLVIILVSWCLLFIFMSLGPVNNAILWSVDLKDRTFAMALTVFAIHGLGDAAAPVVLGALEDKIGWNWAMFIGMCPCVLCSFLLFLASFSAKRFIKESKNENKAPLLRET